ncbi:MAG: ABC transporter substrate-binding protein [Dermatophilus congolensis]|nr:ABC transporter substrate-binding protein [Dermatophilus congolensis]
MISRSASRALAAFVVGVAGLSACTAAPDNGGTLQPIEGGTVTIRGCSPQNPLVPGNTAEVCGGDLVDATTAMLVRYDTETGVAENDIAASITSADNRTYTVRLRPGYLFQDGTEVHASNFVDAWNHTAYAPNKQVNAPFFAPVQGYAQVHPADGDTPTARTMSGLKVVDDHTFTVTLERPTTNLVLRLGYRAFAPLPDAFFADPDAFARAPIGAGPYQVTGSDDGVITLTRFAEYTGPTPGHIDEVRVRSYGSVDAAYKDAQSGLLDVTRDLPTSAITQGRYRRDFPSRFVSRPIGTTTSLNFATASADEHVQNPYLRQALSMAIDRQAIIDDYFGGQHVAATGWVSPLVSGYRPGGCGKYCTYDPEEAKRLLEKAGGYSDQLTLWYNADSDHGPWTTGVCRSIRLALGVNCVSRPILNLSIFRSRIEDGTITGMYRSAWPMNYPSIDNYLTPLFSTNGMANSSHYSNPAFDEAIAQAAGAPDAETRAALYQRAEQMLQADMPSIPMFDQRAVAVWSPRVTNVWLTPKGAVDLTRLQVVG